MKHKAFEGFSKKPAVEPQRAKAGVKVHLCCVGERSRGEEVERGGRCRTRPAEDLEKAA
jgi:hypothetical protein